MKKILNLAISVTLLFAMVSCEDFLSYKKYGAPSSDRFWQTESDALRAADGLYFFFGNEGSFGQGFMAQYAASDDCTVGRDDSGPIKIKNFVPTEDWDDDNNWGWMYQLIKRSNDIINNVPGMNIPDNVKNSVLGQAYYFRAWAYSWIAPYYGDNGPNGGIPIITEDMSVEEMDAPRPASVLTNYDYIIEQMEIAEKYLPNFSDMPAGEYGRPHKLAAWAYGAKAALYASRWDKTKYLPLVDKYCDLIINDSKSKRTLTPKFKDVYTIANNYGTEYIWSAPSSQYAGSMLPGIIFENTGWGIYNCWGYFNPTKELYDSYDPADERRAATILYPGDKFRFVTRDLVYAETSSQTGMLFRKYLSPYETQDDPRGVTINENPDYPTTCLSIHLVRYAEVLLWKAEAQILQNGAGAGDLWFNEVHTRAGLPYKAGASMDDIIKERRAEFAGEGYVNRMLDLIRWGVAQDYCEAPLHGYDITKNIERPQSLSDLTLTTIQAWPARKFDPSVNHVWQIPPKEIAKGKNLKQNIGF